MPEIASLAYVHLIWAWENILFGGSVDWQQQYRWSRRGG